MNPVIVYSCLWVVAATCVAMLPMRWQIVPGFVLLLAAPVLIWMLVAEFGLVAGVLAALAFLSMFRRPLRYYARRILNRSQEASK